MQKNLHRNRVATTRALSMPMITRIDRGAARKRRANQPLLIAAALFFAVLIADTVLMAAAAPSLIDLALLNVSSF